MNIASVFKIIFASFFILFFCIVVSSFHAGAQPDDIELNNDKVFSKKKKPPVAFPHSAHMDEFDCLDCHHKMQNGENVLDPDTLEEESPGIRCQDCHFKKNFRFSEELDPTKRDLMQAFHKQCISCHRVEKGPRTCSSCHKQ